MIERHKEALRQQIEELNSRIRVKADAIDLVKGTQPEIAKDIEAEMTILKNELLSLRMQFFKIITGQVKV